MPKCWSLDFFQCVQRRFCSNSCRIFARMVKVINRLIFILITLSSVYSFYVHNDIDQRVPFVQITIHIVTGIMILLFLVKFNYKWQSRLFVKRRQEKILYVEPVSKSLQNKVLLFEALDLFTYAAVAVLHFVYPYPGWLLGSVLAAGVLEGSIYILINYRSLAIAITSNSIILATNRPNIVRLSRLKAILNKSGSYVFQHKDGRVDRIEGTWVSDASRDRFNEVLRGISVQEGFYLDDFNSKS